MPDADPPAKPARGRERLGPAFSDPFDVNQDQDRLEWKLDQLVREYIRRGSPMKLICVPGADGLLRKYTSEQAYRRLSSFISGLKDNVNVEVVYDRGGLERNLFVFGDSVCVESKKEHSAQKLYSYGRLITEREQVETIVAQFDKEFNILSQVCGLEIAGGGMSPREYVLDASHQLLIGLNRAESSPS